MPDDEKPTDRRFMPEKVRRPRTELEDGANQLHSIGLTVAGSYRREKPTIGDLDILVPPDFRWEQALNVMREWFGYEPIRGGAFKSEGIARYKGAPLLLNLWRVPNPESWGGLLLFATGPYDLNVAMRARAKTHGLTLSQYGLMDQSHPTAEQLDSGTNEEEIFSLLRLEYLTPVDRENWRLKYTPIRPKLRSVNVPSSKGDDVYQVVLDANGTAIECECKGYTYRHHCRHLAEAEAIDKARKKTNADEKTKS